VSRSSSGGPPWGTPQWRRATRLSSSRGGGRRRDREAAAEPSIG
jgi:hypothetical protein